MYLLTETFLGRTLFVKVLQYLQIFSFFATSNSACYVSVCQTLKKVTTSYERGQENHFLFVSA